jgi:hypothetical protein
VACHLDADVACHLAADVAWHMAADSDGFDDMEMTQFATWLLTWQLT